MRPDASTASRLSPPVAVLAVAWTLAMLSQDRYPEASVLAVAVSAASGIIESGALLFAWLTIPSLAIVTLLYGPEAGLEAAGRIAVMALAASGSLSLLSFIDSYRWLRYAGVPPHWALLPSLIARQAQVASALALEARASLQGRGLRGFRLAYRLPLPVLVHLYRYSLQLAESLHHRKLPRGRGQRPPLKPTLLDVAVVSYIVGATLASLLSQP